MGSSPINAFSGDALKVGKNNELSKFAKNTWNTLTSRPRMTRAFMIALDPRKGTIQVNPPIFYQFQFNPNEKTETKKVNWIITDIVGDHQPLIHYGSGSAREIKFKLILNAYVGPGGEEQSSTRLEIPGFSGIKSEIAKLNSFMYPNTQNALQSVASLIKKTAQTTKLAPKSWYKNTGDPMSEQINIPRYEPPPAVLFGWGLTNMLKCIVKDLQIKELFWNPYLDPIRAEADLTLVVDERSSWNVMDTVMRRTLSTVGSVTAFKWEESILPGQR